jgi:glycerophosphoryl diester phosphodiesterase
VARSPLSLPPSQQNATLAAMQSASAPWQTHAHGRQPAMTRPTVVYAHRGIPALLPENTLESFVEAISLGADAIETDVRLTRDGHVVVFHDATAQRVANLPDRVRDCDLSEVERWDVGWGWTASDGRHSHVGKGYRIPTLQEVLAEVPDVFLNVDAKTEEVIEPLVRLVRSAGAVDRVRIASFSSATLKRARGCGWTGKLGMGQRDVALLRLSPTVVLTALHRGNRSQPGIGADAVQVPVRYGPIRFDTAAFIHKAHGLGLRVDFWTVDSASDAQRLFALGADGLVSNDVREVIAAARGRPKHKADLDYRATSVR